MGFERFSITGGSHSPRATLSAYGILSFNPTAASKYGLAKYSHVVLYYDRDTRKIGVEFTDDEKVEGAIKVRRRPGAGSIDISAKLFMEFFDLEITETLLFEIEKTDGIFVLAFDKSRTRRRKEAEKPDSEA